MNDFNTYQKTGRKIIDEYIEFIKGKEPIRRGCSSGGPCFCTGKCQEIIGWRDKIDENTILDIIRKLTEKSEKGNTVKIAEPKNPGCMNHSHNLKHCLLSALDRRPPRLDLARYPHLPLAEVASTDPKSYNALLLAEAPRAPPPCRRRPIRRRRPRSCSPTT